MTNPEPTGCVRPLAETPALLDRAARMLALSEQLQTYARLTDRQADEIRRLKAGSGR